MRTAGAALAGAAAALALAAGCAAAGDDLTVVGAASLADALPRVDPEADHAFAASGTLAAQIREGAPADVYASADLGLLRGLAREGLVEEPHVLATNRLVVLLPAGAPGGVRSVRDLARPGTRWAMAGEGVPAGDRARAALERLGLGDLTGRAASVDGDARTVAGRVAMGEVDAGIAYATDARAAGVRAVELPARAREPIRYGIAVVAATDRPEAARRYVARALGPAGRRALRAEGFGPP